MKIGFCRVSTDDPNSDLQLTALKRAGCKRIFTDKASKEGTSHMFGMLDYRAHKLYCLLTLPFVIIAKLSFYAIVFASIVIAEQTSYGVFIKIAIAYLAMEIICILIFQVFWRLVFGTIKKMFFWFFDVIPAHGTNAEEAKEVVLTGELFLLNKKLENEIENWTLEDTKKFVSLGTNWRGRAFFNPKERLECVVDELKRIHQETGKQPRDLGGNDIEKIQNSLIGGHFALLKKAIVNQAIFNSIIGLIIIVLAVSHIEGKI